MRQRALMGIIVALAACTVETARAADVPILGLKLIVVDKMVASGKAKVVFVAKDASIAKGTGTDPMQIEATLDVAYDAVRGSFLMPAGSNWLWGCPGRRPPAPARTPASPPVWRRWRRRIRNCSISSRPGAETSSNGPSKVDSRTPANAGSWRYGSSS